MYDMDEDFLEYIDWPATLREQCSRISFSPRASVGLTMLAERIYSEAINAKGWNGLSDKTYEEWAKVWWFVINDLEKGAPVCWD